MKTRMPPDWSQRSEEEQLAFVRAAPKSELRRIARGYDWSQYPETVLGWVMAHKSIDLCCALTVFFNGDPARFNYLAKRDVPAEHRGAARVLDNVCLRLNSGFYLARTGQRLERRTRLEHWLEFQRADRTEGRRGRWILDEAIVQTAFLSEVDHAALGAAVSENCASRPGGVAGKSMFATLTSKVISGGLDRLLPRRG